MIAIALGQEMSEKDSVAPSDDPWASQKNSDEAKRKQKERAERKTRRAQAEQQSTMTYERICALIAKGKL